MISNPTGSVPGEPRVLPVPRDPDGPYRVIMVCTGNICRSAMAEVVLLDRLGAAGLAGRVEVASSGVSGEERGNPMDSRARRLLLASGYGEGCDGGGAVAARIASHRAHRITDAEIAGSDLILAMTASHERELMRRAQRAGVIIDEPEGPRSAGRRIRMFREFDPKSAADLAAIAQGLVSRSRLDAPDPWYGGMEDFEDTLAMVERVVDELAPALSVLMRDRLI
ncbi:low molecular weight protein-tyrosine-phosphatase [Actinomyces gaoshouyii]|uniref:low molecular weight protein-tyrosine-phosphatase n=1 Tax=Actinomyces gaoshouyii TaxID=1960083 RepID=UPI0009BF3B54|nr:low molecular weight protein-tyrosine-phosphatase [Actinomyces gaoshouyii]ARD41053.1 protein-tyrosine-phosphatase [Actinomyces gaoshouyii]